MVRELEERALELRPALGEGQPGEVPRAQITDGKSVEVLSTLGQNNWEADARAFAALMRHVREVDKTTA